MRIEDLFQTAPRLNMCPIDPECRRGTVFMTPIPDRYGAAFLRAVAPRFITNKARGKAQDRIIDAVGPIMTTTLREYAINTDLRAAHFAAQICHESFGFTQTEESASGAAYEGREDLGNTEKGDGILFKGRGLIQLTGRANYESYGKALDLDLIKEPTLAADPVTSLKIACEFWTRNKLNDHADADDVLAISKIINTGHNGKTMPNGLDDRKACLTRAKRALGLGGVVATNAMASTRLRLKDTGALVKTLQRNLTAAGFEVPETGYFGPKTEAAVKRFQASKGLIADGVAGPRTLLALGMA